MASDALYVALAEALSKPSRSYRAAKAGLDIPGQALQGYLGGTEIVDKINQRKLANQTLADMLGGAQNVPERARPYGGLRGNVLEKIGGLKGIADITEPTKPQVDNSLEEILARGVREGKRTLQESYDIKNSGALLRTGFSQGSDGTLTPVPGGKPATERAELEIKKELARQERIKKSKFVVSKVDEAINNMGPTTTGTLGEVSRGVPLIPTRAKDLDKTLNTIRASVSFDELQNMRQSSPTGGALGAVSDRENTLLADAAGSLETQQTPPQLKSNLLEIRKRYSNVQLLIENQTGDPEADKVIGQIVSSDEPEAKKIVLIRAVRSRAGR